MKGIFSKKIKIFHMASMARSGETLLLRSLAIHPNIAIAHNLGKKDTKNELKLFYYLKNYKKTWINIDDPLVSHLRLSKPLALLVKQGVWEHKFPFNGFILSRNPISIYASLLSYDKELKSENNNSSWKHNEHRLLRWLKDIDPQLLPGFSSYPPYVQFAIFYNIRMGNLLNNNIPIIHYEDLVTHPKEILEKICGILGVPFSEKILQSHLYYPRDEIGHGQVELSKPISSDSLIRYKQALTREMFDSLAPLVKDVAACYGYELQWENISLDTKTLRQTVTCNDRVTDQSSRSWYKKFTRQSQKIKNKTRILTKSLKKRVTDRSNLSHLPEYSSVRSLPEEYRALPHSQEAAWKLINEYSFSSILDIGSGDGAHSKLFANKGKAVTSVDFGNSVYFQSRAYEYEILKGNFLEVDFNGKQFDCVWASHVLEHQANPGLFLKKCIECAKPNGIIVITVPPLKHEIVGGHLTMWNAGLLIYNLVFAGLNCRNARICRYGYNISAIVQKIEREDIELSFDKGDITKLSEFFPSEMTEGMDGDFFSLNW